MEAFKNCWYTHIPYSYFGNDFFIENMFFYAKYNKTMLPHLMAFVRYSLATAILHLVLQTAPY